jgi:RsiW-degrading membrane proteinase PrsW (M82 family)
MHASGKRFVAAGSTSGPLYSPPLTALILFLPLVALLLVQLRRDIRQMDRLHPEGIMRSPIKRAAVVFVALLLAPWLFVNYSGLDGRLVLGEQGQFTVHLIISFLISFTWYRYLTWLDPFERETLGWEITVFILACGTTFLTFPLTDLVVPALGLQLDGTSWNDWWYCVIAIGLVEETVKLLPLLFILLFTRQADEPFDLILYGSISALGFAFVENTLYLQSTALYAVGGRVLFASVAHMFFTSIIAYSIAMARHRGAPVVPAGVLGLVLAALAHGYYDFWLMGVGRPYVLTLIFFLGSIHLWRAMKNNLVNLSPHYQEHMRPQPVMFRYRIINALLAIFLFTYVVKFLLAGRAEANTLILAQGGGTAAILLFLAISFSSFRTIPGYIGPLRPQGALWRFLLPAMDWSVDLTGRRLLMRIPEKRSDAPHYAALHRMLPLEGRLSQRLLLDGDPDWYLFRPDRPIPFQGASGDVLLVKPHRAHDSIPEDRYALVLTMAFTGAPAFATASVAKDQLVFTGHVHGRLL